MKTDMLLVFASIATSIIIVPGAVLYVVTTPGTPGSHLGFLGMGLFAMLPGLLMGATGAWLAARG